MKVEEKGHWIMKESRRIAKHPFLNRVPPQTAVRHLSIHRLAGTRWNPLKMRSCKFNANVIAKKCIQDQLWNDTKTIADCVLLSYTLRYGRMALPAAME
jgi:hypothetical protein